MDVSDAFPQSGYISATLSLSTVTGRSKPLSLIPLPPFFGIPNFRTVTTIVINMWWLLVVLLGCFRWPPVIPCGISRSCI